MNKQEERTLSDTEHVPVRKAAFHDILRWLTEAQLIRAQAGYIPEIESMSYAEFSEFRSYLFSRLESAVERLPYFLWDDACEEQWLEYFKSMAPELWMILAWYYEFKEPKREEKFQ